MFNSALASVSESRLDARRGEDTASRLPFLDVLRFLSAQLIVLHHLAFYGPLPERVYETFPALFDWLIDYARMAVQVFFVAGGFLAARSFKQLRSFHAAQVWHKFVTRYRRIGVPYLVTLVVALIANEVARTWTTHEIVSAPPTLGQIIAHATFLHDILGYPALSAGIWYLTIDFQLYALISVSLYLSYRWQKRFRPNRDSSPWYITILILSPFAVISLFWFNRHPVYDRFAIYFIGSYYLGMLLYTAFHNRTAAGWGGVYFGLVVIAAIVYPRPRLLVASGTALVVFLAGWTGLLTRWPRSALFTYLGRISYSLFLIHFPVLLLVNAWGVQRLTTSVSMAVFGLLFAYVASLVAAIVLYHGVENRIR